MKIFKKGGQRIVEKGMIFPSHVFSECHQNTYLHRNVNDFESVFKSLGGRRTFSDFWDKKILVSRDLKIGSFAVK